MFLVPWDHWESLIPFYVECRTYRHIGDTDQLLIRIVKLFLKIISREDCTVQKPINPPAQATVMFQTWCTLLVQLSQWKKTKSVAIISSLSAFIVLPRRKRRERRSEGKNISFFIII